MSLRGTWSCLLAGLLIGTGCSGLDGGASDGWGPDNGDPADTLIVETMSDPGPGDGTAPKDADAASESGPDNGIDSVGPDLHEVPTEVDYMIVAADDLRDAAEAFAAYRESTGYSTLALTISDITGQPTSDEWVIEAISKRVRAVYDERDPDRPFYLLILGDALPVDNDPKTMVPAPLCTVGWDPGYSDNGYADMDGDLVPDLAVGRIPVRTNKDALLVLDKVKNGEESYEVGPWNRRLSAYAGEGGFGEDIDAAIELVAQKAFEAVPYDFDVRFAYDN
ncbi:MAG: hypothetical protein GXP54_13080, partial [Deltaproteobacteria bacterium]|nr:hypothetical protein [Deltaproteobacteria bacterium]